MYLICFFLLFDIRLPVGGFRPILPSINRPSNSQRTSIMTLTRGGNNSDLPFSSNRTSTISSNLSDSRILREVSLLKNEKKLNKRLNLVT